MRYVAIYDGLVTASGRDGVTPVTGSSLVFVYNVTHNSRDAFYHA